MTTAAENTNTIRTVVAGTSHGLRVHVPALRAHGFEIVGLVGYSPERTARRAVKAGIPGSFTDLETALKESGAEAVVIATPPDTHADMVHLALAHGCHVLCEKPFALNLEEARGMYEAAEKAGVVHLMGNQFRMMPGRVLVGRAIQEGLIGEARLACITQFAGLLTNNGQEWPSWWFDKQAGGGWLGASGSHMVDMLRTWFGEFASVSASLPQVSSRKSGTEDSFLIRFTMQSGLEGMLVQSGGSWGGFAGMNRISGTDGTLDVDGDKVILMNREGERQLEIPPELALPEVKDLDTSNPYLAVELPPAMRLSAAWYRAIHGEPVGEVPVATFADGYAAIQVIEAIRQSAAEGGALVPIPPR